MVTVREVKTKKEKNLFVDFPTKLYEGNEFYVHPLRGDEMGLFSPKKNVSFGDCEIVFYLAYNEKNEVVGRICGVLQRLYNQKNNKKRVRFVRFDLINDLEVAKALLEAVEDWAKEKGMTEIHGPLGFNDLDREGLLVDGFDRIATFEENYNYPYYAELLEKCGYGKEVDWVSNKLFTPEKPIERLVRMEDVVLKRYNLKKATEKSKSKFIKKYKKGIFDVIDDAYGDLYGVVPYTDKLRESIISQFKMVIDLKYALVVTNEKDEVVCFGFAIPQLAYASRACKGKLFPTGVFKILKATKNPKVLDLALVGVRHDYLSKGITAIVLNFLQQEMIKSNIEFAETNHCLETNSKILAQWEYFKHETHKRFRCYVKNLENK